MSAARPLILILLIGARLALAQGTPPPTETVEAPLGDFGIAPGAAPGTRTAAPPAVPPGYPEMTERVVWDRTPIHLVLPVGVERQVHFPAPVRVGLPQAVAGRLRTQAVAGTVYWLAHAPFEPVRVQVRETASGRLYLLDLEAVTSGGEAAPVYVQVPPPPAAVGPPAPAAPAAPPAPAPEPPRYDYVTLTRFAAQQLYAPERLLPELPGVSRVPVRRRPLPLYEGGAVEAVPEVAWSDGTLYVTAVRLTNVTAQPVLLDPRAIRGRWLARTLLYSRLAPAGSPEGTDVAPVFLLSPRPFEESF